MQLVRRIFRWPRRALCDCLSLMMCVRLERPLNRVWLIGERIWDSQELNAQRGFKFAEGGFHSARETMLIMSCLLPIIVKQLFGGIECELAVRGTI